MRPGGADGLPTLENTEKCSYTVAMKKVDVVRARIDPVLKAQAAKVLASCGLELSDAIRLYFQQIVLRQGIPFPIDAQERVHYVPAEELWQIKGKAQARDHAPRARTNLSGEKRLLIRPDLLRGADVKWSSAKMSD